MIHSIRVWLWGIVSELEYHLYPWKTINPPQCVIDKYNLVEPNFEKNFNDDWLKSHEDKISRLQKEMIWVTQEIHKLNVELKTHD